MLFSVLCRMQVIFIVSVGVLFVWEMIDCLFILLVIWFSVFGVMLKFQLFIICVVEVIIFVVFVGVSIVIGLFMVKYMFGLMIQVEISVIIVMKDFINILLQLIKYVCFLFVSIFGVVLEEISVWKLDIVLQVMVINRNGNRLLVYIGLVLLINLVSVGMVSVGCIIKMFIVRLMIVLIFRKVERQLCGVSSNYIGSIVVIKL